MKAYTFNSYGTPQKVLQLQEVGMPVPKNNEVVVKVTSTAVNDYDWAIVTGKPNIYRLMFGLFKPKMPTPGMELVGIIDTIGSEVTDFKKGDCVYGDISEYGFGTFAEYICIHQRAIKKLPETLDPIQAVAIPHAGLLAYQALEKAGIQTGQNVLINGAGGGVGTLAIQLCKMKDCTVTGVDAGAKLELLQELGYDQVLDYMKVDFTKQGILYDVILDCKTNRSPFKYLRSLAPKGTYVTVGGKIGRLLALALCGKVFSLFSSKRLLILSLKPNRGLEQLEGLMTQNKLKCAIDGPYAFQELPRLVQNFGEGKHQGKIVVKLS